jgi:hypothetical protein
MFTSRTKREESIIRFKDEKYAKLLVKLQGFVGTTTSGQLKREFFEEQYQSWLYASDRSCGIAERYGPSCYPKPAL